MAPPKSYRANEVLVDFGGKKITGRGDDEFISIADSEALTSKLVGGDGETVFSQHSDESGEVTVTVLATSDANDVFQDQVDAQRRGPGIPYKRLIVRDLNGRAKFIFPYCCVQGKPTVVYAKSARSHAWVLAYSHSLPGAIKGSQAAT
jgi:hypothetical protein